MSTTKIAIVLPLTLTLVLFLAPIVKAQQRIDTPSLILAVSRHVDHFDAMRSDGVRLVEFQALRQVREYAARHGYRVVMSNRERRGRR